MQNKNLKIILFAISVALLMATISCQQSFKGLAVTKQATDKNITFAVSVENAPNKVSALGFDIEYDPDELKFVSHQKGKVVENFDMFNANRIRNGLVRAGGFGSGKKFIQKGKTGKLILLEFELIGDGKNAAIKLTNMVDDIASWEKRE